MQLVQPYCSLPPLFFERSLMTHQRESKWPLPIQTLATNDFRELMPEKKRTNVSQIWIQKRENWKKKLKDLYRTYQRERMTLSDPNVRYKRFPRAIVHKGKNQSFSNLNPKKRKLNCVFVFFKERVEINSKIKFEISKTPFSCFSDAKSNISHQLERS